MLSFRRTEALGSMISAVSTIVAMTLVDLSSSQLSGAIFVSKGPARLPSVFSF